MSFFAYNQKRSKIRRERIAKVRAAILLLLIAHEGEEIIEWEAEVLVGASGRDATCAIDSLIDCGLITSSRTDGVRRVAHMLPVAV